MADIDDVCFVSDDLPKKKAAVKKKKPSVSGKSPAGERKTKTTKKRKTPDTEKKKTVKRHKKTKTKIDFREFNIETKTSFYKATEQYVLFSPYGKDAEADIIGIDIGEIHLGLTGIKRIPGGRPKVAWFSLLSLPSDASHFVCDKIVEILSSNKDFEWLSAAKHVGIELQVQMNPTAQIIASGVRSCLRTIKTLRGELPDVEYVHGNKKYDIGPKYSQACQLDPLRQQELTGSKNKPKRKLLGEHDVKHLLEENDERRALRFLTVFEDYADQLHDITDSYLIACAKCETIMASEQKASRKKKTKVD